MFANTLYWLRRFVCSVMLASGAVSVHANMRAPIAIHEEPLTQLAAPDATLTVTHESIVVDCRIRESLWDPVSKCNIRADYNILSPYAEARRMKFNFLIPNILHANPDVSEFNVKINDAEIPMADFATARQQDKSSIMDVDNLVHELSLLKLIWEDAEERGDAQFAPYYPLSYCQPNASVQLTADLPKTWVKKLVNYCKGMDRYMLDGPGHGFSPKNELVVLVADLKAFFIELKGNDTLTP